MEDNQDVQVAPSTTEQVVNEGEQTSTENSTTQKQNEEVGTTNSPDTGHNVAYSAVDEYGVPWINRAKEYDRKFEDLTKALPKIVEEALGKTNVSGNQQQQYSVSQLEAYAIEHPEYRPWVEEQKEKLRNEQLAKLVEERLVGEKKKTEAESRRQQAYAYVANNNPDLFTVQNGQKVWDAKSPVVQMIGQIMSDPRFANDPDGLVAATDIAYGRYLRQQNAKMGTKVQTAESALKKEQRKNMVEGTGNSQVVTVSPVQKALNNIAEKRTKGAAADAIKEIFKAKGVLR